MRAAASAAVVRDFIARVKDQALGQEVLGSLTPGQALVGIVQRELAATMGEGIADLNLATQPPAIVLMAGLQGSGKTTTAGKLAALLRRQGRSTLVAACDLQRPAAVEQLRLVIEQVAAEAKGGARVEFYGEADKCAEYGKAVGVAVSVAQRAVRAARDGRFDTLIVDTAGRLHVEDALMRELEGVRRAVEPHQVMLVVDGMAGQDALTAAKAFHERLPIDGIVLTKFDADPRGGAALSVRKVTGAPILFTGTGERFDALEPFHPERVAGRILGMGDVVSLVEKAQQEVDQAEAERVAERMAKGQFTLDDFVGQLRTIRRLGPIKNLLGMLPGVGGMMKDPPIDEGQLDRVEGMVRSMTSDERESVRLVDQQKSRARRIAQGSGVTQQEVGRLAKQFEMMQKMTQQMAGMGAMGKFKAMRDMADMAGNAAGGFPGLPTRGSTQTQSIKSRFKQRKKR